MSKHKNFKEGPPPKDTPAAEEKKDDAAAEEKTDDKNTEEDENGTDGKEVPLIDEDIFDGEADNSEI